MGTSPLWVLRPTVHFQVTVPDESAVLSASPFAVLDPEAYCTTILQPAFFAVWITSVAAEPRVTVPASFVTVTARSGGADDSTVASGSSVARGSCVAIPVDGPTSPNDDPSPHAAMTNSASASSAPLTADKGSGSTHASRDDSEAVWEGSSAIRRGNG